MSTFKLLRYRMQGKLLSAIMLPRGMDSLDFTDLVSLSLAQLQYEDPYIKEYLRLLCYFLHPEHIYHHAAWRKSISEKSLHLRSWWEVLILLGALISFWCRMLVDVNGVFGSPEVRRNFKTAPSEEIWQGLICYVSAAPKPMYHHWNRDKKKVLRMEPDNVFAWLTSGAFRSLDGRVCPDCKSSLLGRLTRTG